MKQVTRFGLVVLVAVAMGCSNNTANPLAPTGAGETGAIAAVPEGAPTLKVTAPASPLPASDTVLDEALTAPVLSVSNAETRFAGSVQLLTRFQLQEGATTIAEPLVTPGADGRSNWQAAVALKYNTTYRWRARAELGDDYGPWSVVSEFRTPEEPAVVIGFTVPPSCGPIPDPPGNRMQCVLDVARESAHWGACVGGSGVACHRFVRDVARALALGDPGWGLITKNPREQQCTWFRCGGLNGEGYGEDVVAYRDGPDGCRQWWGFDIVIAAGIPGASPSWQLLEGRRPGNCWAPVPSGEE